MSGPQPSGGCRGNWKNFANTQEEEDAFDYVKWRNQPKPTGVVGSVAHMVKGALGGGILGGHVAYMKAGVCVGIPFNLLFGMYMTYCLYILVISAQILYRRTRVTSMSYPDVGEAAMACFPNPNVAKYSKIFRYTIDAIICIDLFGACACYQIIIAKSIKQLVENTQRTPIEGLGPGYPDLRVYLACMILPIVLICLITHLKWLAPFSIVANIIILFCIMLTVYYAFHFNPNFENLVKVTELYNFFEYVGMSVFSMSCSGVVIPIENNMKDPRKYPQVLMTGMSLIICCTFSVSFFGYVGFLQDCESPITVNFPMTLFPKILKGGIAIMIYVTHALNYWVPFNLCFYYIRSRHDQNKILMWELIYRAIFVFLIGIVAIIFPNINALMGFLGTFCLSNMAFIWPNMIYLMTIWQRPGLGKYKWRLWKGIVLISIGLFILVCGTVVNFNELLSVFR
ncbi:proton-coupled amino acid transporter-like protein pathetic [Nymphalis io]|uniref:proton-coupled amino acid transporter-like protein pathetic n=1 Tax=Inachis io TaxID=171585 RepID=UPI0021696ABB|nr:proton-coupled amino acid transporter-like protein pathetic [Nymphalis io]